MSDTQRGLMTKAAVIFIILLMALTMMPKEANANGRDYSLEVSEGAKKVYNFTLPKGYYYRTQCSTADSDIVKITQLQGGSYYNGSKSLYRFEGLKPGLAYITIKAMAYNEMMNPDSYTYTIYYKKAIYVSENTNSVPLEKILISHGSTTLQTKQTRTITISCVPSNTTVDRTVKWTSSNNTVASVSNGTITAHKAGTAVITATCGGKTAHCKVTVKAPVVTGTQKPSGTTTQKPATQKTPVQKQKTGAKKPVVKKAPKAYYMNVTSTYKNVNQFRTKKSNQWYWKKGNKSKQYVYGLKKLKRDKTLENIAKTRAKEQWTQYYVNGLVTHTRPNGKSCFSVFPKSMKYKYKCENLAFYYTSSKEVVEAWAEKNNKYGGQGHRRNMLSTKVKRIGIACYVKNGYTCWAMVMTQ